MNSENKKSVLICDIGGTNVRFGLYDRQQGDNVVFDGKYKCVEFSSFEEAVGKYLKKKNWNKKDLYFLKQKQFL